MELNSRIRMVEMLKKDGNAPEFEHAFKIHHFSEKSIENK